MNWTPKDRFVFFVLARISVPPLPADILLILLGPSLGSQSLSPFSNMALFPVLKHCILPHSLIPCKDVASPYRFCVLENMIHVDCARWFVYFSTSALLFHPALHPGGLT